jgi:predicted RNase H-like HicB family nuclease
MEKLTAIYERTEDGWWVVSVPEIPGAHSQGRTLEEAREMIKDATRLLLEARVRSQPRSAGASPTHHSSHPRRQHGGRTCPLWSHQRTSANLETRKDGVEGL